MAAFAEAAAVGHCERFDVITAPDGTEALSFRLACATATEHYQRTTAHGSSTTTTLSAGREEPCWTGVRVYEGSQVLAAFLCQFGLAFGPARAPVGTRGGPVDLPPPCDGRTQSAAATDALARSVVVEMGCGCGLAGFTAACVYGHTRADSLAERHSSDVTVVFTDASQPCLALVRQSGELNRLPVKDGEQLGWSPNPGEPGRRQESSTPTAAPASELRTCSRLTLPLFWNPDGVRRLQHLLRQLVSPLQTCVEVGGGAGTAALHENPEVMTGASAPAVDLLLGSDLMYYRVDIVALLSTARRLLSGEEGAGGAMGTTRPDAVERCCPFLILCHAMRIPDGRRKLSQLARALGFGLVECPLAAFLDSESVTRARGWGGMEVVILYLRAHVARGNDGQQATRRQREAVEAYVTAAHGHHEVAATADEAVADTQAAAQELNDVRAELLRRIALWREAGRRTVYDGASDGAHGPSRWAEAIAQAERAAEHLQWYTFGDSGGGYRSDETAEVEAELLHMLL